MSNKKHHSFADLKDPFEGVEGEPKPIFQRLHLAVEKAVVNRWPANDTSLYLTPDDMKELEMLGIGLTPTRLPIPGGIPTDLLGTFRFAGFLFNLKKSKTEESYLIKGGDTAVITLRP